MKVLKRFVSVSIALCLMVMFFDGGPLAANEPAERGILTGRIMLPEELPAQETVLLLFDVVKGVPPKPENYFRLPDAAGPVSVEGFFKMRVPVGTYWYGVIKMPLGKESTMPKVSDWLYVSRSAGGEMFTLSVWPDEITDIGDIFCPPNFDEDQEAMAAMVITGQVVDANRNPLPGFVVEAYTGNQETRALFSSDSALKDGRYSISVPPGTYYLRLRPPQSSAQGGVRDISYQSYHLPEVVRIVVDSNVKVIKQDLQVGKT